MKHTYMNQKIENYLKQKNTKLDQSINNEIETKRTVAINSKNDEEANYYWCLRQIYRIQSGFLSSFESIKNDEFENAWQSFDTTDIELGFLESNFTIDAKQDDYHLAFIGHMIKEYQKLFPYHHFFSREMIVKEEKCSICGQKILLRHSCDHIVGKLYMGELCLREVTDLEFKAIAIVKDPFDKYAILKIEGKEYNYSMLEFLLTQVHDPYEKFYVETRKEKMPKYLHTGRNELCPCGSGKKYKKCHFGSTDEFMDHHIIHLFHKGDKFFEGTRTLNTWK